MFRKKFNAAPAAFLLLTVIVSFGCSKSPEANVAVKAGNTNQSPTVSSNAVSASPNASVSLSSSSPNAATAKNASPSATGADKDKPAPANYPKPQIGSGGDDFALFQQARGALNADKEFDAVIVEIKEGNLILTGNVSSEAQKTKAGQMVQAVKGIKTVKNNLRVGS